MSRVERLNVVRELVELRRENAELRETIRQLRDAGNAAQKRVEIPEPPSRRELAPPWEREGLTKAQWQEKRRERRGVPDVRKRTAR